MAVNEISMDSGRRYRTNPDFILRKISGEAVLVPIGDTPVGNSMISVNETFTFLWELFAEPIPVAAALKKAQEIYEDPTGDMGKHILSFVADCVRYGMIIEEEE